MFVIVRPCSSLFVLVRPCSALFDVEQRRDQPNMDEVGCGGGDLLSGVEQNREDDYKLHQQEDLRPTNTLDPSDLHNTEGNL